jgi:hypothetical protein
MIGYVMAPLIILLVVLLIVKAAKKKPDTPSGQVAAGWYPDPEVPGHVRYWDGAQWTDHRQPKPPN